MDRDALARAERLVDLLQLYLADRAGGTARELSDYAARVGIEEEAVAQELARIDAAEAEENATPSNLERTASDKLPGYRLVRELGHGGQGTVVLAEDLELGRLVALKFLPTPLGFLSAARLARLLREVTILARLDHPGICTVYRAHLDNDPPFVVMRYVPGSTLAELLETSLGSGSTRPVTGAPATSTPISCAPRHWDELARLLLFFEEAASALHVVHEAGVVHRDIKPANVVVQHDGRPVLLDFGLARTLDAQDPLVTRTGEMFGTPAYMSPEQLSLESGALDRRTDVYSLGVMLFECLTGRRPFEAPSQHRLELAICLEPVPRASGINAELPRDLDIVLAAAMEKDRTRRYATALDFAEELRRVRERRPVIARPTGLLLRLRRWSQRNPAIATAVLLLALGAAGLSVALVSLTRALRIAESRNLAAEALSSLELNPLAALDKALQSHDLSPGEHNRSALYAALIAQRVERVFYTEMARPDQGDVLALAPDRRTVAVAREDGATATIQLPEGIPRRLGTASARPTAIDTSRHGDQTVVGCEDGTLVLFSDGPRASVVHPSKHRGAVRALVFSADGEQIASGGDDGLVRLYASVSGEALASITPRAGRVGGLRFSPDGRWLVSWSNDAVSSEPTDLAPHVWNTCDGSLLARLEGPRERVDEIRFSPGGSWVAAGSDDGTVHVWKLPSATCQFVLPHPAKVHDVAFSPDGYRLAIAFDPDGPGFPGATGAWVVDAARGERLLDLRGHQSRAVGTIDWSEDGKRLLTASYDGTTRVWGAHDGRQISCFRTAFGLVYNARFIGGGDKILVRAQSELLVARAEDLAGERRLIGYYGAVVHAAFSPDGRLLVTGDTTGTALVHRRTTGELQTRITVSGARLTRVAFCHENDQVLLAAEDGSCSLFSVEGGDPIARFDVGQQPVNLLRMLADGKRFLASSGAMVSLLDLSNPQTRVDYTGHEGELQCLDVSPDENLLATGAADRTVRLWDLASGGCRVVLRDWDPAASRTAQNMIFDVRFSPDGLELLTAGDDGCTRCYAVPTGELLWSGRSGGRAGKLLWLDDKDWFVQMPKWTSFASLARAGAQADEKAIPLMPPPLGRATAMDVSPDGKRLLISSTDGRTLLWDLTDRSHWATVAGHEGAVNFAAFSPDGSCFVTTSDDGTARLWPTDPASNARASRPEVILIPEMPEAGIKR